MAYGPGESRFVEEKRHFEKPIPISDLVFLDRERCILCDRCTRFASEVAGDPLISFTGRGNETQVITFPDEPFASYFTGNTVQICPVGALTAKPYRFKARPWDLEQEESTCTTCAVGCRVTVQSSRNRVLRYQGVDIDPVNWGWLCDKGRFDFEAIEHEERLASPLLCDGDTLVEARGQPRSTGRRRRSRGDHRGWGRLGRSDRRGAAHQRGRVRVGEAREGGHRHRQRRRTARRRARSAPRRGASDCDDRRGVRRPTRCRAGARPEGRAARPVPPGARRRREARADASSSCHRRRPRSRRSLRRRCATGPGSRPRSWRRSCPAALLPRVSARIGSRPRRTSSCSSVVRRSPRQARRPRPRSPRRRGPPDGSTFLVSVAPRQRARRDRHGAGAGSAARPGDARRWAVPGSRRTGGRCPPSRGSTRPASSGPRPTVASGAWCFSEPTLSRTSPIAGSPSARCPGSTA